MTHFGRDHARADDKAGFTRTYSPALQPLFQSLLATLANIDLAHERERDKLSATTTDPNLKIMVLEKLKERHREQREPYIQQLAILQDRIQRGWH